MDFRLVRDPGPLLDRTDAAGPDFEAEPTLGAVGQVDLPDVLPLAPLADHRDDGLIGSIGDAEVGEDLAPGLLEQIRQDVIGPEWAVRGDEPHDRTPDGEQTDRTPHVVPPTSSCVLSRTGRAAQASRRIPSSRPRNDVQQCRSATYIDCIPA